MNNEANLFHRNFKRHDWHPSTTPLRQIIQIENPSSFTLLVHEFFKCFITFKCLLIYLSCL
jgi:hypothetical protein